MIANPPNLESKKSKKLYVEGLKLVANEVDQLMSALEQLERVEPGITEKYKDKIQELSLAPKKKEETKPKEVSLFVEEKRNKKEGI